MSQTAIILFAHGARDPQWAAPLQRVREMIAASGQRTELAFLELMTPSLGDCLAALAVDGMRRVVVVPMFIANAGHLKRDLPDLVARLREQYPGVDLVLTDAVGEADIVVEAMARFAIAQIGG